MSDLIYQGFLESARADTTRINRDSEIVQLVPDPVSGDPPRIYQGILLDVEHYERDPGRTFRVANTPVSFRVEFPAALRSPWRG